MWGAPDPVDAPARKAAAVALAAAGLDLPTRIGLHVGTVAVGHFGTQSRLQYDAIGDAVNLCSRLEGANKAFGTRVLCSAAFAERISASTRLVDEVRLLGKREALAVHELLDTPLTPSAAAAYGAGLAAYAARDWDTARAAFARVLDRHPDDGPARTMSDRCVRYAEHPPPEDWDGVHSMVRK